LNRLALYLVLLLALGTGAVADLTNPSTLTLKEISSSRFIVELTLPIIQGKVLKARPVLPDVCVIEGDVEEKGDGMKAIRTWAMTCDPDDLVGKAIGMRGLLGTSLDVQLTLEFLDGRKYVGQLRPTQGYFLVPPSPTLRGMAVDIGGVALRHVLGHPEIAILILLCVFWGVRFSGLFTSAGAFAAAFAVGQWLKTENWIGVSPFLPVTVALIIIRGKTLIPRAAIGMSSILMALLGILYGGGGLPIEMVLSRSEENLAYFFTALGTMAGLTLVILCARQLHALIASLSESARKRLRFYIAYLGGVAVSALGLYHVSAPLFVPGVTPSVPIVALLGAIALGAWCGGQSTPVRSLLPGIALGMVIAGTVLSVGGVSLPQMALVLYASMALVGLLLVRSPRLPVWGILIVVAVSSFYHGAHAGGILRDSVVLPVAQATAMIVLLVILFLAAYQYLGRRGSGAAGLRLFGLATALLAVLWRFAEYGDWIDGEVAVKATMGLFPLPVLTIILALTALLIWPRKRRFQPVPEKKRAPVHWVLVVVALFMLPVGSYAVPNPFYSSRAPTADEARPIMNMLLTDTYLAFNLPDEDDAFDRLARNLSEDLVPGVYLDSRRRLTAGTRKGAKVTVKDVSVMSVDAPTANVAGDMSFTYPCKWVVTARVKHWQHIHDRQNIYMGALTIRVEDDRWKISHLELFSEEREILSWRQQ
jgi:hydrogenase/urease accessory protein HupE